MLWVCSSVNSTAQNWGYRVERVFDTGMRHAADATNLAYKVNKGVMRRQKATARRDADWFPAFFFWMLKIWLASNLEGMHNLFDFLRHDSKRQDWSQLKTSLEWLLSFAGLISVKTSLEWLLSFAGLISVKTSLERHRKKWWKRLSAIVVCRKASPLKRRNRASGPC
jgi:plasmid replication initiation protein